MCSGTVKPDVVINLPWIAEGVIKKINVSGTYDVDWRRISLQYDNVGPSDQLCPVGKACDVTNPVAINDYTWKYSDCRFIVSDDASAVGVVRSLSRHFGVKEALLGTAEHDPLGLQYFSSSVWAADAGSYTFDLLSVTLYVHPYDRGTMAGPNDVLPTNSNKIPQTNPPLWKVNTNSFLRTSWNLRSVQVPSADLNKIFFYSILPLANNSETDSFHAQHLAKYKETVALHNGISPPGFQGFFDGTPQLMYT
jgi:hypothetical protein